MRLNKYQRRRRISITSQTQAILNRSGAHGTLIKSVITQNFNLINKTIRRRGSVNILLSKTQFAGIKGLQTLTNAKFSLAQRLQRHSRQSLRLLNRSLRAAQRLKSLSNATLKPTSQQEARRLRMIRSSSNLLLIIRRTTTLNTGLNRYNTKHVIGRGVRLKRNLHNLISVNPLLKTGTTRTRIASQGRNMNTGRALNGFLTQRLRQRRTSNVANHNDIRHRVRNRQHLARDETNTSSSRLTLTGARRRTIRQQRTHKRTHDLTTYLTRFLNLIVNLSRGLNRHLMTQLSLTHHSLRRLTLNRLRSLFNVNKDIVNRHISLINNTSRLARRQVTTGSDNVILPISRQRNLARRLRGMNLTTRNVGLISTSRMVSRQSKISKGTTIMRVSRHNVSNLVGKPMRIVKLRLSLNLFSCLKQ